MNTIYLYLYLIVVNIVYYHTYPFFNRILKINPNYDMKKHKKVKRICYVLAFIPIVNAITIVLYLFEDFVNCFKFKGVEKK